MSPAASHNDYLEYTSPTFLGTERTDAAIIYRYRYGFYLSGYQSTQSNHSINQTARIKNLESKKEKKDRISKEKMILSLSHRKKHLAKYPAPTRTRKITSDLFFKARNSLK